VRWRDALVFAARSVRRRIGRAVLTVLAVALAAALLSSLLIAAGVARERVLDDVARGGPLTGIRVDAAAPTVGSLDSDRPPTGTPKVIDERALARIKALAGVRSVTPVLAMPVLVFPSPGTKKSTARTTTTTTTTTPSLTPLPSFSDVIVGADLHHAGDLPISLLSGRLPTADARDEVAVTLGYLRRLGLTDKDSASVVGTEVEYGASRVFPQLGRRAQRGLWMRGVIVGVVAQEAGSGDLLVPLAQAQAARDWTLAGFRATGFGTPIGEFTALFVVADNLGHVSTVRQLIDHVGYSTSAPETLIAQVQRYVHVVEIVLGGIGLIALLIAALGITNALLAAVRERRREIGVLKAIGGRDRDIRRMFLLEAAMLGSVGGVIGAFVGFGIARGLAAVVNRYLQDQNLAGVHVGLPAIIVFGTIGGAALLALVAGTIPAQRAARLPARRAMGDQ
jgi:hypothetical protein